MVNYKRNNKYLIAFGKHLRQLRKQKGVSMEELALQADVEYTQIANIERGKINTTISTVLAVAEALDAEVSELFRFKFPS
jgi:transcriptional regulator with XRE-family HTH domain